MRRAAPIGAILVAFVLGSLATVSAQGAPFCRPDQTPEFVLGFAALKAELGPVMGEPIECEHADSASGDTLQATTTGLAFWRKATNTTTFTDGWRHWGLTADGIVYWEGESIDPPAAVAAQQEQQVPPGPARERLHAADYLPRPDEFPAGFAYRELPDPPEPSAGGSYAGAEFVREGGLPIVRYDVFLGDSPERAQEWSEAVVGRMREQGFAVAPARGIGERAVRGTRFGRGAAIYTVVFQVGSVACATTWAGPAAASITADVVRYARLVEGKARANPTGYR